MLSNTRFCGNIYNLFIRSNNKHLKRIGLRDSRNLVSYRFLSSGKRKPPDKTGNITRPDKDSAPAPPPTCKTTTGVKSVGQPSLMDQLPKPECSWDEEYKKRSVKYRITLIAGILLLAATLYAVYVKEWANIISTGFDEPKPVDNVPKKTKRKSRRPWIIPKSPQRSSEIPNEVQYLLVGGGTASFSAFRAIKSIDPKAEVLVIGNEPYYPYMRPPLSKEMFYEEDPNAVKKLQFKQWNGTERSVFYEPDDFYSSCADIKKENGGVAVARGWTVKRVDATERKAYLEDGKAISYQKCLIATGAKPKNHPVFTDLENELQQKVSLYRNIFDFEELADIIDFGAKKIAIVGGSFLGSELACALARRGRKQRLQVIQIFKESGNMGKILPEYLSKWTTDKVQKEGVTVMNNVNIDDIDLSGEEVILYLNNGKEVTVDHVVLALGVQPNTELATTSNLETDKDIGGYLVNAELEARSNLYVAGDCACFYDTSLGRRRVEHHDHAVVSGRLAGENMTGAGKPYFHQSMFWSDLGPDVGFEAIGIVDASLPTVGVYAKMTKKDRPKAVSTTAGHGMRSDVEEAAAGVKVNLSEGETLPASDVHPGEEDYGKGVIFYLRDDIVVGIVLWNVFHRMPVARQVLKDERKYEDLNEVAKLFNIHKD